ncbi:MAG: polyprenol monophosphomannose synthase [Candidatus Kerfeldbacteria bacterium]
MNHRISILLPTYNEADNLPEIVKRLSAINPEYEIVVVDDGSPDGTGQIAERLTSQYRVTLLQRGTKLGLASAVIDGIVKRATGDIVVIMDADLSHDESIIPQLVANIEAGSEVAIGSRFASGGSTEDALLRRIFSWCAKQVARIVLGVRVQDPMSGYFAMRRETFVSISHRLKPRGFKILLEVLVRLRPTHVAEVGFRFRGRTKGESKLTSKIASEYFRMIWDLWQSSR